jgi:hypothetical protein|tara:strand:+ start:54 stop:455 length:402 start_codon:yes stop_codon:yes gene_type:complete
MADWKIFVPNNDEPVERVYDHDTPEEALEDYNENYDSDPEKAIRAEPIMFVVHNQWSDEKEKFYTEDEAFEWICEQEVTYYSVAMNYLIENDCSLNESLEEADAMGFTTDMLNSEILATILLRKMLNENIYEE